MDTRTLLLPLAFLIVAAPASATDIQVPFEKYRLANGLEVILSEDHRVPLIHVEVLYHVGSKDEPTGKTGFAHLFEHMMFQATRDIAEDTWYRRLFIVGATDINGSTSTDWTNYFETMPSNQLPLALWMESDRMGFLLDALDEKSFRNQQDVVRNERRQRYEMQAYGQIFKTRLQALYPENHPYHHTTIGEHEDLARASLDDVRDFFRRHYTPANATLAIVGDIAPKAAKALVERYFGSLPGGPAPPRPAIPPPTAPVVPEVAMEANVQLARIDYIWHAPVPFGPDEDAIDLATTMLADGKTARLYRRLVYETQTAQSVNANFTAEQYGGRLALSVTLEPGRRLADARALIDGELARLGRAPFTAAELERAKTRFEAAYLHRLETNSGRATVLLEANHYTGDPRRGLERLAAVRALGLADVQAAAQRWLGRPKLVITVTPNAGAPLGGRVVGSKAAAPSLAVGEPSPAAPSALAPSTPSPSTPSPSMPSEPSMIDPWRRVQPGGGPPAEVKLPRAQRGTLANGLPVVVVENHSLPLVEVLLAVGAGAERASGARAGLADLTADLLDEGSAGHDALAFADALDAAGAHLTTSANSDSALIALDALTSKLGPALDLFAEAVTAPAFAEAELERRRRERLTALLQQRDQPEQIAVNVANRAIFGDEHAYGLPLLGTEASLRSFTRADVNAFYQAYYRPNNATLIVVGDTTLAEITRALDARLAGWRARPVPALAPPRPPRTVGPRKVLLVDQPQASQSVIAFAQVGVARSAKDYFPLLVANRILGGTFTSRINVNLREQKGYSYGAFSRFVFSRGPGLFISSGSVRGNVTKEALAEMWREILTFRTGRLAAGELADSKASLAGSLPVRFQTNGGIALILAELVCNQLPVDYYDTFAKRINAVTAADIKRVARRYLTPDQGQIVVVGDKASIAGGLQALGLGPLEERGRLGEILAGAHP